MIVVELWAKGREHFVRIHYNGDDILPTQMMRLSDFEASVSDVSVPDVEAACRPH